MIEHVADGLQAEARLAAEEYDAVVLDLRLPGKDGLAVLKAMRARDDRTPVLILTAQDTLDERVRGLNLGADDYLPKPFAIAELEARILALIRRSRGARTRACNAARWCSMARAAALRSTASRSR